jgi:hypothetical protein
MKPKVIPLSPERERAERLSLRRYKNARATVAAGGVIADDMGGVEVTRRGACVFVTVRNSSAARRAMERFCERWKLVREMSSEGEDFTTPDGQTVNGYDVWKVVGDAEALSALAEPNHVGRLWWVKDAQLGMNGRVGGRAMGGGELSEGAKRRMHVASALRLRENERAPTEGEMVKRERAQALIERARKDAARKNG